MTTLTAAAIAALIHVYPALSPAEARMLVGIRAVTVGLNVERVIIQMYIESEGYQWDKITAIGDGHYAVGICQLNTQWHGVVADPVENVRIGVDIMADLLRRYDYPHALVAYCMGETAMRRIADKYGASWREHLSRNVNAYIDRVMTVGGEEKPMTSKLSLHVIPIPPWIKEAAGPYVKAFNPPARFAEAVPQSKLIVRYYGPDKDGHDWNWQERDFVARRAYRQYFDACRHCYDDQAGAWAIEFVNEPPIATLQERINLNYTLNGWIDLMRQHYPSLKLIGGNFSVGWPTEPSMTTEMFFPLSRCDYIGVHEYWRWPYDAYSHLEARYRVAITEPFLHWTEQPPQIIITECGLTQAVKPGSPDKGWKTERKADGSALTEEDYLGMLERYNAEISQDPYVLTACVYTVADKKWETFDISKSMALKIRGFSAPQASQTLEQAIIAEAQKHVIPYVNVLLPDAPVLYRTLKSVGRVPQSKEFDLEYGGKNYRCLVGRQPPLGGWPLPGQKIAYAEVDDWDNVRVVEAKDEH